MTTTAERYHHARKQNHLGRCNTAQPKHTCKEQNVLAQVIHAVQAGHKLYAISFHDASCTLRSLIFADYSTERVYVVDYPPESAVTAFGQKRSITWSNYRLFLLDRCAPDNASMDEYIRILDLIEFDPLPLVEETHGTRIDDGCSLTIQRIEA